MVYVGRRFEARREDVLDRKFKCVRCGFACRVEVHARGAGTAQSAFMVDEAGAARRAADDAVYGSAADADRVVALARCPRCRGRNRAAWARFAAWTLFKLACFGAVIAVAMTLLQVGPVTVALVSGGAVAALYILAMHRTWWRIDRRMRVARS